MTWSELDSLKAKIRDAEMFLEEGQRTESLLNDLLDVKYSTDSDIPKQIHFNIGYNNLVLDNDIAIQMLQDLLAVYQQRFADYKINTMEAL